MVVISVALQHRRQSVVPLASRAEMVDLNVLPFACVVQLWGRPRVDFWRIPWPFQHFHPCDTLCVPPRAIEGRVVQRAIEGVVGHAVCTSQT